MMLADHAQVSEGKLFIAGGGWTTAGPGPIPCGIALLFHVPWQQTNERTGFTLRLLDEDGDRSRAVTSLASLPSRRPGRSRPGGPPGWLPGPR